MLIDVGESMANNGRLSPLLGMWTANLVLGAGALILLVRAAREAPIGFPSLLGFTRGIGGASFFARSAGPGESPVVVLRIPRFSLRFPNTMDRYVAREFTRYFVLILAALVVVYVLGLLIDVIADTFQNRIKGKVVLQYLAFEQPQILFYMLPLATLMATLVNFAIFTKTSELTAAKAGGMSLYRLSVPVVLMGLLMSGACFALQEYVLPYANRRAAELRDEIKNRPVETLQRARPAVDDGSGESDLQLRFLRPRRGAASTVSPSIGIERSPSASSSGSTRAKRTGSRRRGPGRSRTAGGGISAKGGRSRSSTSGRSPASSPRPTSSRKSGARSR